MKRSARTDVNLKSSRRRGDEGTITTSQHGSLHPDPDAMDLIIASEMNRLSLEERANALEDLHGIKREEGQSPEAIASLVEQVKSEISKLRVKTAYDKAVFLCPSFVHNPDFILMFLRSENFNVALTVKRLMLHFEHKLELFGIERLARSLRFDDLDEDDKGAMFAGSMQVLPEKDRSGRTVIISIMDRFKYKDPMNQASSGYLASSHWLHFWRNALY